jgi:hypothetical protein
MGAKNTPLTRKRAKIVAKKNGSIQNDPCGAFTAFYHF